MDLKASVLGEYDRHQLPTPSRIIQADPQHAPGPVILQPDVLDYGRPEMLDPEFGQPMSESRLMDLDSHEPNSPLNNVNETG
ncbi:hypothetical protein [Acidipropionibacterium virtanenii]|uniref:hypothetical protein n=1 Tax=Acidipropionibacterium virtanenii TaxID=2057246 RepID=UPI0011BDB993|nr:hypothetical protein [Acidipropionibacterium virtanenii]